VSGYPTRRVFSLGLAALAAARPAWAQASSGPRIASLNWALSETLYAVGVAPVAAAELAGYARMVGDPPTPPGVADLGFQSEPSLELLAALKPDLILIQDWQSAQRAVLERLGRVESFAIFSGNRDPYPAAREAMLRCAELAGVALAGVRAADAIDAVLAAGEARLAARAERPVYLVQALDPANLVVYSQGSLFHSVLERLGLRNAWAGPAALGWGSTRIAASALSNPQARVVVLASPNPASGADRLFSSPLWQALPAAKAGRVAFMPAIWGFGGLPTARRFARALTSALEEIA